MCAKGKDTVAAEVAPGKVMHPLIAEMEKSGVTTVTEHAGGSKTVTYRGTDRGQYLRRSDLQVCACRVLEQLMATVP